MIEMNPEMTIEQLSMAFDAYIECNWSAVLTASKDELIALFPEYEDATYGMYLGKLIPPAWQELQRNGFQLVDTAKEDDFVIADCLLFRNSLEKAKWGTPGHEIRIFWMVIKNHQDKPIGTLVMEFSHSHIQFDIPDRPKIFTFEETERKEIVSHIMQKQKTH
ncbi:DUF6022 family protein [Paenibacillus sp. KQZ6P-2]|uniref:DUF6022 family protein n=1 Tax=Paenibacillus mangrovi TaxID=2931978 RepID=A0A9X1WTS6_9BACL|nr:DUF6022 family protein [Paenibacillus mangrovi]MCJ8014934.1 DUF6022 family protein [Paenibacillus mangrovi]